MSLAQIKSSYRSSPIGEFFHGAKRWSVVVFTIQS